MHLQWFRENRLKLVSVMAVSADCLMGLAGGVSLFLWRSANHLPDVFLMAASGVALVGHAALLLWGKGGKIKSAQKADAAVAPVWIRPSMPWRYPLDWAFLNFILAGALYTLAGLASGNPPLALKGFLVALASALGWLWPQERKILGFQAMQITVILYATASVSTFFAAFVAKNGFMFAAACLYICMNAILYTVRKDNQSSFTQSQPAIK